LRLSAGSLADSIKRRKKIFRRDNKKAQLLINDGKVNLKTTAIVTPLLIDCPICKKKMYRTFLHWGEFIDSFSGQLDEVVRKTGFKTIPLAIDKCEWCNVCWIGENKIEVLQYLFETSQNKA